MCRFGAPLCYSCSLFSCPPRVNYTLPAGMGWLADQRICKLLAPAMTITEGGKMVPVEVPTNPLGDFFNRRDGAYEGHYTHTLQGMEVVTLCTDHVEALCVDQIAECSCELAFSRLSCMWLDSQQHWSKALAVAAGGIGAAFILDLVLDGVKHACAASRFSTEMSAYSERVLGELANMGLLGMVISLVGVCSASLLDTTWSVLLGYVLFLQSMVVVTFLALCIGGLAASVLLQRRTGRAEALFLAMGLRHGDYKLQGHAFYSHSITYQTIAMYSSAAKRRAFFHVREAYMMLAGLDRSTVVRLKKIFF